MDFTDLETPCIPLLLSFSEAATANVEEFDPLLDLDTIDVKQEIQSDEESKSQEIPDKKVDFGVGVLKQGVVVVSKMNLRARAKKSSSSGGLEPNTSHQTRQKKKIKQKSKRSGSGSGITFNLTSDVNPKSTTTTSEGQGVDTTRSKIKDLLLLSNFCESKCKICDELILKLSQHFSSNHQNPDQQSADEGRTNSDSIHDDDDDSPNSTPMNTQSESESDVDLDLNSKKVTKKPVPKKTKTKYPRRFSGSICPANAKRFTYKVNLDEHMKKIHAKESMSAMTMADDELKMQIQTQIMDKALQLAGATNTVKGQGQPDDPNKTKTKVNFTCTECGAQFRSARGLHFHFRADHPSLKLQYNCTICGNKKFPSMFYLKAHVAQAHCAKDQWERLYPFSCEHEKCGRRFKVKTHLEAHVAKCHPPGGKSPFTCTTCDKVYKNTALLRAHAATHDKSHMCDVCGKCFSKSDKLKVHKMIHTGERPHICDQCGKSFVQKNGLNDHYKIHTGERPHKCQVCGKGYILAGNLRWHMKTHHQSN